MLSSRNVLARAVRALDAIEETPPLEIGQEIHLGFGARGGAGFNGKVIEISPDGRMVKIRNPEGKEYTGQARFVSTRDRSARDVLSEWKVRMFADRQGRGMFIVTRVQASSREEAIRAAVAKNVGTDYPYAGYAVRAQEEQNDSRQGVRVRAGDPLTPKGGEIMRAMKEKYGDKRGEEVFYASANKGTITGVHDTRARDVEFVVTRKGDYWNIVASNVPEVYGPGKKFLQIIARAGQSEKEAAALAMTVPFSQWSSLSRDASRLLARARAAVDSSGAFLGGQQPARRRRTRLSPREERRLAELVDLRHHAFLTPEEKDELRDLAAMRGTRDADLDITVTYARGPFGKDRERRTENYRVPEGTLPGGTNPPRYLEPGFVSTQLNKIAKHREMRADGWYPESVSGKWAPGAQDCPLLARAGDALRRSATKDEELITPYGRIDPSKEGFVVKERNGTFTGIEYDLRAGNKWKADSKNFPTEEAARRYASSYGQSVRVVST